VWARLPPGPVAVWDSGSEGVGLSVLSGQDSVGVGWPEGAAGEELVVAVEGEVVGVGVGVWFLLDRLWLWHLAGSESAVVVDPVSAGAALCAAAVAAAARW
jgi:hypothetical protein